MNSSDTAPLTRRLDIIKLCAGTLSDHQPRRAHRHGVARHQACLKQIAAASGPSRVRA